MSIVGDTVGVVAAGDDNDNVDIAAGSAVAVDDTAVVAVDNTAAEKDILPDDGSDNNVDIAAGGGSAVAVDDTAVVAVDNTAAEKDILPDDTGDSAAIGFCTLVVAGTSQGE